MVRPSFLGSFLGMALFSCGGPAAPVESPSPVPTLEGAEARDVPPEPPRQAGTPSSPEAAASSARLIALPKDPAFLARPLPPSVPDRYSSWRETERIEVGQSHLTEVDRLPSGHLVALGQAEGQVRVYERRSKRLVARQDVLGFQEFEPTVLLAYPTAPDRYVVGTPRGLGVYDAASGALLEEVDRNPVWKLRWSDDGRILMALSAEPGAPGSSLRFFAREDASALTPIGTLPFEGRVDAWALSPDARVLALVHYPAGVSVLDLETGARVFSGNSPRYAGDVAISPDGRLLAVAGEGLLVVDLADTQARAFYSYVKNNMGHVRFSPSGDAVIASSYDGKIRILEVTRAPSGALGLELLRELSHAGEANVYAFSLSEDGSELVSASGDQTLRAFAGKRPPVATEPSTQRVFRDLTSWKALLPAATEPARPRDPDVVAPPRPTRIQPGLYACKITAIYKLRDCYVYEDASGHTRLEFAEDNLLHLGGILWDDGPAVRFEGKLLSPSTVLDCPGCDGQALHAVFRGDRGHYKGLLTFRTYYDPLVPVPIPPLDVRIEEAADRYPLVLEYKGPLPVTRQDPRTEE